MGVVMEHEILTDDGMTDDEITIYYYIKKDKNGNLILINHRILPKYEHVKENLYPSSGKSILTSSWNPYQRKTYLWKDLHDKERRLNRIILTMFGYSNTSKPTIDYIIRKTNNVTHNNLDTLVEASAWKFGSDTKRNLPPDYYLKHPEREKYLNMLTDELGVQFDEDRKNKKSKKSTKRKPVKKCKCK